MQMEASDNQSSSAMEQKLAGPVLAYSLNAKVQQVLLKLNRHLQVFNSSNCTCVPLNWRCDGQPDCLDASDEISCGGCRHSLEDNMHVHSHLSSIRNIWAQCCNLTNELHLTENVNEPDSEL